MSIKIQRVIKNYTKGHLKCTRILGNPKLENIFLSKKKTLFFPFNLIVFKEKHADNNFPAIRLTNI